MPLPAKLFLFLLLTTYGLATIATPNSEQEDPLRQKECNLYSASVPLTITFTLLGAAQLGCHLIVIGPGLAREHQVNLTFGALMASPFVLGFGIAGGMIGYIIAIPIDWFFQRIYCNK